MCVHVCMFVCLHIHMYMGTCLRQRSSWDVLSQTLSIILKHGLSFTWSSSSKLAWLVSSRDLLVLAFLELRVQVCTHQSTLVYLCGSWDSRLGSSCFHHVLWWEHFSKKCFWSDNSDLNKWRGAIIILKCQLQTWRILLNALTTNLCHKLFKMTSQSRQRQNKNILKWSNYLNKWSAKEYRNIKWAQIKTLNISNNI